MFNFSGLKISFTLILKQQIKSLLIKFVFYTLWNNKKQTQSATTDWEAIFNPTKVWKDHKLQSEKKHQN